MQLVKVRPYEQPGQPLEQDMNGAIELLLHQWVELQELREPLPTLADSSISNATGGSWSQYWTTGGSTSASTSGAFTSPAGATKQATERDKEPVR